LTFIGIFSKSQLRAAAAHRIFQLQTQLIRSCTQNLTTELLHMGGQIAGANARARDKS